MQQTGALVFEDRNFKLAVIQELMYNQQILTPAFDIQTFVAEVSGRQIDLNVEGYDPIPEVLEYFLNLEIDASLADKVTELYQDGGNQIHLQIAPLWDGEDDAFSITSAADAQHFPQLRNVVLLYSTETLLDEFQARGIDAEWV